MQGSFAIGQGRTTQTSIMKKRGIVHFLHHPAGRNPAAQPVIAHIQKRQRLQLRRQAAADHIMIQVQVIQAVGKLNTRHVELQLVPRQVSILYALVLPKQGRHTAFYPVPVQLHGREVQVTPSSRESSRQLVVRQHQILQARGEVPEGVGDAPRELVAVQPEAGEVPEAGQGRGDGAAEVVEG